MASAQLVSLFWAAEASLRSYAWVERVPSSSNVADGPSRLNYEGVMQKGAVWSEPDIIRAHELTGQLSKG